MASIREEIASALIADKDIGKLKQTFQDLRKEHGDDYSSLALADVAKQGHPNVVAQCLRAEQDPFPNDKMCVSSLVNDTFWFISNSTRGDPESFAKVIGSFKPTDFKPLASIRHCTLDRNDAVKVLESVMAISPELIIDSLPSWLAGHKFDQRSLFYSTISEGAFHYLASFATESVLEKALSIVKANEHYKVDFESGPEVLCCKSRYDFPQDLVDKLGALLALMKARNEIIRGVLQSLLPTVLVDLMLDYLRTDTI